MPELISGHDPDQVFLLRHDGEPTVQIHSHRAVRICDDCLDWLNERRNDRIEAHRGWHVNGIERNFSVGDVARSTDHYAKMGFESSFHDETYSFAQRERALTVHLARRESDEERHSGSLYIHCEDADELGDERRKAGVDVTGPNDEEYGKREGSHTDPDGNLIRFGPPLR